MEYCRIFYNGISFDDAIPGYLTLNVIGRGLKPNIIETIDLPGTDGSHFVSQKVGETKITVEYLLTADNSSEFNWRFSILNNYLKQTDGLVKFSFADEGGFYREGVLSEVENPPYNQFRGVGKFTLLCPDPYKYLDIRDFKSDRIPGNLDIPVVPDKMIFSVNNPGENLRITNETTNKFIELNKKVSTGDVITFDKNNIKDKNNTNLMKYLNILSDFEDFTIKAGDKISLYPKGELLINARRKAR